MLTRKGHRVNFWFHARFRRAKLWYNNSCLPGLKEESGKVMSHGKKTKSAAYLCHAASAVALAGIIIFFIGLYYCMFKAGIPYQDPPLELQKQYAVYMGIEEILVHDGVLLFLGGGIFRLLLQLALKRRNTAPNG